MVDEAGPIETPTAKQIRVLFIEDDPALPELVGKMLAEGTATFGFTVSHTSQLSDGLERLSDGAFDVVLLDLGLPDSDGLHAVEVLRVEMPQVAVVVLTGSDNERMAVDALRAGAQDYLVKAHVERRLLAHTLWSALERQELRNELRIMSLHDELTGLHNRRGFELLAAQQLKLADRYGKCLLLIFADIDGLKGINDRLGHREGDRALVETAAALAESFRGCDIVARWAGDEFVVLASDCRPAGAGVLLRRLVTNVDSRPVAAGLPYELRITAGSASYDPDTPCSLGDLVRRADEDMYQRKRLRQGPLPGALTDGGPRR
jgi:two-component system cell cycle response regulator